MVVGADLAKFVITNATVILDKFEDWNSGSTLDDALPEFVISVRS
jgi:hypothetical protein